MGLFDWMKKEPMPREPFIRQGLGWKNNTDSLYRDYDFQGGRVKTLRVVISFIKGRDGGKYPYVNFLIAPPLLPSSGTVTAKISKASVFDRAQPFQLDFSEVDGGNHFAIDDLSRGVALVGDLRENEDIQFALMRSDGEAAITFYLPNEGGFAMRYDLLRAMQA